MGDGIQTHCGTCGEQRIVYENVGVAGTDTNYAGQSFNLGVLLEELMINNPRGELRATLHKKLSMTGLKIYLNIGRNSVLGGGTSQTVLFCDARELGGIVSDPAECPRRWVGGGRLNSTPCNTVSRFYVLMSFGPFLDLLHSYLNGCRKALQRGVS